MPPVPLVTLTAPRDPFSSCPFAFLATLQWVSNWWADVAVWEEKIRRSAPALVKGDGPIQKGRRWFKQFYTEGSAAASEPVSFDW